MDVLDYLDERSEVIDEVLDDVLSEEVDSGILNDSCKHLIDAGGKRVRPVLALTSCEAVGGNSEDAVEIAAALELLHTFTLVHDDIIDEDRFRRGEKTVHEKWNDSIGIISGDALFSKAFQIVAKTSEKMDLEKDVIIRLFDIFSKTSYQLCQGQASDVNFENQDEITEEDYMRMVKRKTGSLMSASTKVGGIIGDGSRDEVDALREYGKLMGVAFQIQDDILEIREMKGRTDEGIDGDFRKGKWTFLTVKAYEKFSPSEKQELLKALHGETNNKDTEKMIDFYEKVGAVKSAEEKSRELIDQAKDKLKVLPDSESKNFLLELAEFSINREV